MPVEPVEAGGSRGKTREAGPPLSANEDSVMTHGVVCEDSVSLRIERAIEATAPYVIDTNVYFDESIWNFARRVLGILPLTELIAERRVALFDQWFDVACNVGELDYDACLSHFLRALDRVEQPYGAALRDAKNEAIRRGLPTWVPPRCSENTRLLAGMCRELQRRAGVEPFFLSCDKAAELIGIDSKAAHSAFGTFQRLGRLVVVQKGKRGFGLATRYRYVGDDL
jgi:hypothetical protein